MEHDLDDFEGKVAIVTGGASGIGRAAVETLHQRGASVVIADIRDGQGEELARALGTRARFHLVDVAEPEQIAALVDRTVAGFGRLDIMVNNAAVSSPLRGLLDDDLADFHRIMSVNVLGVMAGTKFAARHMADHGGGSVVNMTTHMCASFMVDGLGLKQIDEIGIDKVMWSSDYPHNECTFGYSERSLAAVVDAVGPEDAVRVVGGNIRKFLGV